MERWGKTGFVPVSQCIEDVAVMKLVSNGCRDYLAGSDKAKLQWQLEENLKAFESGY